MLVIFYVVDFFLEIILFLFKIYLEECRKCEMFRVYIFLIIVIMNISLILLIIWVEVCFFLIDISDW